MHGPPKRFMTDGGFLEHVLAVKSFYFSDYIVSIGMCAH